MTTPAVVAVDAPATRARVRNAAETGYARGQIDERKRHRAAPLLVLILALAAVVGAALLYFAFREGSFARGGAVVDGKISEAGSQVSAQTAPVVQRAGALTEQAGDALKSGGQAIEKSAPKTAPPQGGQQGGQ